MSVGVVRQRVASATSARLCPRRTGPKIRIRIEGWGISLYRIVGVGEMTLNTPLLWTCVTLLVSLNSCDRAESDDPLVAAADRGDVREVTALLDRGYDVNKKNPAGNTALVLAASRGNDSLVQLLLDRGAKVNLKNDGGRTALMFAASDGLDSVLPQPANW